MSRLESLRIRWRLEPFEVAALLDITEERLGRALREDAKRARGERRYPSAERDGSGHWWFSSRSVRVHEVGAGDHRRLRLLGMWERGEIEFERASNRWSDPPPPRLLV